MKWILYEDIVTNPANIKCNHKFKIQYIIKILILFKAKLRSGQLFDCQKSLKQIETILSNNQIQLSTMLLIQIYTNFLELYIKKKNKTKKSQVIKILKQNLKKLNPEQKQSQIYKINSLILFDINLQTFDTKIANPHVNAITLYNQNKIPQAIEILKKNIDQISDLIPIKKILIGKMYSQIGNIECFQWFDSNFQNTLYQKFESQLLYVSSYRVLFQKLQKGEINEQNLQQIKERYEKKTFEMNDMNKKCSESKIKQFKQLYSAIKNKAKKIEKKQNILRCLSMLSELPCYPSPSLYQLQINMLLLHQSVQNDTSTESKNIADKCIELAEQLGIYSWSIQKEITQDLARIYERQRQYDNTILLIQRCEQLEQDAIKLQQLKNWKESIQKIKQEDKNLKSINYKSKNINPSPPREQIVGNINKSKNQQKIQVNKPQEKLQQINKTQENLIKQNTPVKPIDPKPKQQQSSCCLLF